MSSPTHQSPEPPTPSKIKVIVATLLTIIGLGLLVYLIVFVTQKIIAFNYRLDHPIEFNITDASIMQFNLTSNDSLYYNFNVTITVRNIDNDIDSLKGTIKVISSYKGNQLPWVTIEPIVLGSKKTSML
jgi:hypothetical protein